MRTKNIETKETLSYAVLYLFKDAASITFMIGHVTYIFVKTIYDAREDGRGYNTLAVVYNYHKMKYEVLVVSDEKIGNKKITIL